MKMIFAAILTATLALGSQTVTAEGPRETRRVCVDVKDNQGNPVKDSKTGKVKQNCKEVRVHKKLEGTEVPKR